LSVVLARGVGNSLTMTAEAENLEDRDALLVHADRLCARGDPRGELIMVQDTLERAPTPDLHRRQAELLSDPRLGLPGDLGGRVRATWRRGFFDVVIIDLESEPDPRGADVIRAVLRHPSARLLGELTVGFRGRGARYREVVEALEASRAPALRHLALGTRGAHLGRAELGEVMPLLRLFPRLESLALRGRSVRGAASSSLRALTLELERWDRAAAGMAASPGLEALTFNAPFLPWGRWLLTHRPGITRLGWRGPAVDHSCIAALVRSELAAGLAELDLSGSAITDADLELFYDSRSTLSALEAVDVRDTRLTARGLARLRGLVERVVE